VLLLNPGPVTLSERVRRSLLQPDLCHPAEQSSVVLRAYRLPPGKTYAQLHDALKAEGFVIYAGQGNLSKTLFRISTMGDITSANIDRLLQCFARLLG
jgi:2-aminoethylphosphonate-pyruvate transaminase